VVLAIIDVYFVHTFRQLHQVELVICSAQLLLPVIILVIILILHKLLAKKLRSKVFTAQIAL